MTAIQISLTDPKLTNSKNYLHINTIYKCHIQMRRFNYKRSPINLDKKCKVFIEKRQFRWLFEGFRTKIWLITSKMAISVEKRYFSDENALYKRIIISNDAILEWFQFFLCLFKKFWIKFGISFFIKIKLFSNCLLKWKNNNSISLRMFFFV